MWLPASVLMSVSNPGLIRAPFPLFFPGLQDSKAEMQDSKGDFSIAYAWFLTSENAVFFMGEYGTVPAGDRKRAYCHGNLTAHFTISIL